MVIVGNIVILFIALVAFSVIQWRKKKAAEQESEQE